MERWFQRLLELQTGRKSVGMWVGKKILLTGCVIALHCGLWAAPDEKMMSDAIELRNQGEFEKATRLLQNWLDQNTTEVQGADRREEALTLWNAGFLAAVPRFGRGLTDNLIDAEDDVRAAGEAVLDGDDHLVRLGRHLGAEGARLVRTDRALTNNAPTGGTTGGIGAKSVVTIGEGV